MDDRQRWRLGTLLEPQAQAEKELNGSDAEEYGLEPGLEVAVQPGVGERPPNDGDLDQLEYDHCGAGRDGRKRSEPRTDNDGDEGRRRDQTHEPEGDRGNRPVSEGCSLDPIEWHRGDDPDGSADGGEGDERVSDEQCDARHRSTSVW